MPPGAISTIFPARIRLRHRWITFNPLKYIIVIPLLRPQHPSICLALNCTQILVLNSLLQFRIELIRIDDTVFKYLVKIRKWLSLRDITQTQTVNFLASRWNFIRVFNRSFRPDMVRIYGMLLFVYDVVVDPIFCKMRQII